MVDLKRTAEEIREDDVCCVGSEDMYPWGMRLHLQKGEIEKLGLGLPEVGSKLTFTATAVVQEVSKREVNEGESHQSVELQLVEMDVPNVGDSDDDKAERLYGSE